MSIFSLDALTWVGSALTTFSARTICSMFTCSYSKQLLAAVCFRPLNCFVFPPMHHQSEPMCTAPPLSCVCAKVTTKPYKFLVYEQTKICILCLPIKLFFKDGSDLPITTQLLLSFPSQSVALVACYIIKY